MTTSELSGTGHHIGKHASDKAVWDFILGGNSNMTLKEF